MEREGTSMMNQSPQWPDEPQPSQSPGSASPLSRLVRSRPALPAVAVASAGLIVALFSALLLALSSGARGSTPGGQAQNGQAGQNGSSQTGQAATVGSGAPSSGSGGGNGGGNGGGGSHSTPTPPRGSATPTPTSGIAVVGGGGLTFSPAVHQVVSQATLSGTSVGPVVATCPTGEIALSGGWAVAYNSGATIYRSARTSAQSWAVYVRHSSSVGVTTYAECLANASGAAI